MGTRALILGPGGLRGAYGGGVVATLGRKLGCDYFDALYTCSAGSYTGSYFVSGQPDMIEAIWRECVHDKLLMRWNNVFKKHEPVLELFYLNNVLRSASHQLNTKDLLSSPVKFFMVATECESGEARYFSPQTVEEFFLQVRASAAVPYFHPSVSIDGSEYMDGGFSDPLPIERALADGHDEIVVVSNRSRLNLDNGDLLLQLIFMSGYPGVRRDWNFSKLRRLSTVIEKNKSRVRVISPSAKLATRWHFDSAKSRINQIVDLGITDALTYLA